MASLKGFARRIKNRAKQVEEGVNRVIKDAAIGVDQTVVLATPVDTGRARANWRTSLGSPIREATEDTNWGGELAASVATIKGRKTDENIYISNNVPYIGRLNDGSSAQAPSGFVQTAIRVGASKIRTGRILR